MLEAIRQLLATLAISFDLPILEWIQAHLQCTFLDKSMPIITLFGDGGIFWIAVAVVLLIFPKYRKVGFSMGAALILGVLVCNVTMKPLIARIRPYDLQETLGNHINLLISAQHDYSFPSGHTIASFEACVVLLIKDKRMGIPAAIIAFAVAFSRLYLYVHYPTDVIFSMFAGILLGLLGCAIVSIVYKFLPEKRGKYQRAN